MKKALNTFTLGDIETVESLGPECQEQVLGDPALLLYAVHQVSLGVQGLLCPLTTLLQTVVPVFGQNVWVGKGGGGEPGHQGSGLNLAPRSHQS